ncbi:MAG: hypothetical protein GY927_02400, partial [bacterium]|nr:hypothetical protein [bacterium]
MSKNFEPIAIAIVGRGCVLPGAENPTALWTLIHTQKSAIRPATVDDWQIDPLEILKSRPGQITKDAVWSSVGGYLPKMPPFSHKELGEFDPALDKIFHLVAHAVHQALDEYNWVFSRDKKRAGLIMGNLGYPVRGFTDFTAATLLKNDWINPKQSNLKTHSANRFHLTLPLHYTANLFGLNGPCFALDAACASGLYAVKLACDRLSSGEADFMLAGGVNASDFLGLQIGSSVLHGLSHSGLSRPFSNLADGLVPAQGVAVVALKRLKDAVAEKDNILGVVRGIGLSNDGRAGSFLTPSIKGQSRALRQAYAQAGVNPEAVGYIECHVTSTQLGDATEIRTLNDFYANRERPVLGSLKSCIGHTITASGAAGLLKVLAMLEHSCLPGTPNTRPLNPVFDESPFEVIEENREWSKKKLAGVSCFGLGGNNAHLVVEAWNPEANHISLPVSKPIFNAKQRFALVGLEVKTHRTSDFQEFQNQMERPSDEVRSAPIIEQIGLNKAELIFPPSDLKNALGQQLLISHTAMEALQDISFMPETTGVFVGMQTDAHAARYYVRTRLSSFIDADSVGLDEAQLEKAKNILSPAYLAPNVIGAMANISANRLNHILSAEGTGYAVSAEELSGDTALDIAMQALAQGEISTAIVGAVDLCREQTHQAGAKEILPDKSEAGDATVVFVLKTIEQAKADNDTVLAELSRSLPDPATPSSVEDVSEMCAAKIRERYGHAHCAQGFLHLAAALILAKDKGKAPIQIKNQSFTGNEYTWQIQNISANLPTRKPPEPIMNFPLRRPEVNFDSIPKINAAGKETEPIKTDKTIPNSAKMRLSPPPSFDKEILYAQLEHSTQPSPPVDTSNPAMTILQQMTDAHNDFLIQQQKAQLGFLHLSQQIVHQVEPEPVTAELLAKPEVSTHERMLKELQRPGPAASALWEWPEMLKLARGKISEVFGPEFREQDDFAIQVRLPEPPLLLCERVLAIDASLKSMGTGTIWTEHSVTPDKWYLHNGRMPAGIFIECGQADLTLISYLGVDFLNRDERAYRLLGCEITWLGEIPKVGDTLKHEIRITSHAQQGDIRLFFFEYDCWVNGALCAQVRHGNAGFFTREELNESKGVIWEPTPDKLASDSGLLKGPNVTPKRAFSRKEVEAFTRGELWTCFGDTFAYAKTHHRTPTIEPGRLNFIHQITHFEPEGGPVGRGYMRAVQEVSDESCFLDGHFLNDPCMPGTLMANGCQQMLSFFSAALGFTLDKDGWLFAPKQNHPVTYLCRGEINPQSKELVYELFVDEIVEENGIITLYAHMLCTTDGLKALLAERSAICLVPGWPADN